MARLHFVADCHIGNHTVFGGPLVSGLNSRCLMALSALNHAAHLAHTDKAQAFVVAGDLFDTSEPLPQQIAEVQRILDELPLVVVLRGNHDMVSSARGDHALGPLEALKNVLVAAEPLAVRIEDTALLCVPFQTGDAREWFPEAIRRAAEDTMGAGAQHRVLAFHLGVIDDRTPPYLRTAHDAVPLELVADLMEQYDIRAAFCGNWHEHRVWQLPNKKLVQIGATAPTGFDNPGWNYGRSARYDTATHPAVTSNDLQGPRFFNVNSLAEVAAALSHPSSAEQRFFSLKGEAAGAIEQVRAMPGVTGARAVVDNEAARAATRAAATAVRKAETLDEALSEYVAAMPVAEGVARERVLALAKTYLGRGA